MLHPLAARASGAKAGRRPLGLGVLGAGALLLGVITALPFAAPAEADRTVNGFPLESDTIDADAIRAGGPVRDQIPALDDPAVVPAAEAPWPDDVPVVGVEVGGEARAYPLAVLAYHELANDTLGGVPILVSYCPLCGTALVFDRRIEGEPHRFGVSGLLYKSDLLMFDRESESLWSQIRADAVTGPLEGRRLALLRSRIEPWSAWRARHPQTTVLSRDTGHRRRYGVAPYGDYATSEKLMFPVEYSRRYHPKMPTLGLRRADGPYRAYPALELVEAGGEVRERFDGEPVRVAYDPESQTFDVEAPGGIEVIEGFWFAWIAFHPNSSVFTAEPSAEASPHEDRDEAPAP